MKLHSIFALLAFTTFCFAPITSAALLVTDTDWSNYDVEMEFDMEWEENLAEGRSGDLQGTYQISTDSDDEVYWNVDYNCGFNLIITDENILETDDYEIFYEWENECTSSSLDWEYLISQGEYYSGGVSPNDSFVEDGAHYWAYFELYTTEDAPDFDPVSVEFDVEFDELDKPFSDVNGHWGENYINALATLGDVGGYDDNTFRPDQKISRAEVVIIALNALTDPYSPNDSCEFDFDLEADYEGFFSDVDASHWASAYIEAAYDGGVVSGYDDDTFRPNDYVTRAEALSILLETYFACGDYHGLDHWYDNYDRHSNSPVENDGALYAAYQRDGYEVASEENLSLGFSDVFENWQRLYVHFADLHGFVEGYDDGTFQPNNSITRAEVAKLAWLLRVNPHDPEPF